MVFCDFSHILRIASLTIWGGGDFGPREERTKGYLSIG